MTYEVISFHLSLSEKYFSLDEQLMHNTSVGTEKLSMEVTDSTDKPLTKQEIDFQDRQKKATEIRDYWWTMFLDKFSCIIRPSLEAMKGKIRTEEIYKEKESNAQQKNLSRKYINTAVLWPSTDILFSERQNILSTVMTSDNAKIFKKYMKALNLYQYNEKNPFFWLLEEDTHTYILEEENVKLMDLSREKAFKAYKEMYDFLSGVESKKYVCFISSNYKSVRIFCKSEIGVGESIGKGILRLPETNKLLIIPHENSSNIVFSFFIWNDYKRIWESFIDVTHQHQYESWYLKNEQRYLKKYQSQLQIQHDNKVTFDYHKYLYSKYYLPYMYNFLLDKVCMEMLTKMTNYMKDNIRNICSWCSLTISGDRGKFANTVTLNVISHPYMNKSIKSKSNDYSFMISQDQEIIWKLVGLWSYKYNNAIITNITKTIDLSFNQSITLCVESMPFLAIYSKCLTLYGFDKPYLKDINPNKYKYHLISLSRPNQLLLHPYKNRIKTLWGIIAILNKTIKLIKRDVDVKSDVTMYNKMMVCNHHFIFNKETCKSLQFLIKHAKSWKSTKVGFQFTPIEMCGAFKFISPIRISINYLKNREFDKYYVGGTRELINDISYVTGKGINVYDELDTNYIYNIVKTNLSEFEKKYLHTIIQKLEYFFQQYNIKKVMTFDWVNVWQIAIDNSQPIIKGTETSCTISPFIGYFHTHPALAESKQKVPVSFPSLTDYIGLYQHFTKKSYTYTKGINATIPTKQETVEIKNNSIFHCVCIQEGIYIISLNQNYIPLLMIEKGNYSWDKLWGGDEYSAWKNSFEYDYFREVRSEFYTASDLGLEKKIILAKEYCEFMKKVKTPIPKIDKTLQANIKFANTNIEKIGPLFHVIFLDWESLKKGTPFSVAQRAYFDKKELTPHCFIDNEVIYKYQQNEKISQ